MENIICIIFDLDDVLIHEGFYPEIIPVDNLEYIIKNLYNDGYILAIASYNQTAKCCLEQLNLDHYFSVIIGRRDIDFKKSMLQEIFQKLNINSSEAIFFDDVEDNITTALNLNCNGILVNYETGITIKNVECLFKQYLSPIKNE